MEHIRQNSYVERELRRRREEAKRMVIAKVSEVVSSIALVFCTEAIMFAFVLM